MLQDSHFMQQSAKKFEDNQPLFHWGTMNFFYK